METLLEVIHFIGIISFSAAGAMVAIDHETDLFGVIFLSVITCFGGGMLRDVIAGQAIDRSLPVFFTDMHVEIVLCVVTAALMFLVAYVFKRKYVEEEQIVDKINNVLDALGIGVFAAAGTEAYIEAGALVAIVMGMLSSIGGSITRDIMLRDIPFVLRKRIYALAVLSGSAAYYVIAKFVIPNQSSTNAVATVSCVALVFLIRMCATAFKWNMPKAIIFSELKENGADEVISDAKTQENDSVHI